MAETTPQEPAELALTLDCMHKHRTERTAAECARRRARPRCVQCGALIGRNPGAYYRATDSWTCGDCHYADFG